MNLEDIILSEAGQSQTSRYYTLPLVEEMSWHPCSPVVTSDLTGLRDTTCHDQWNNSDSKWGVNRHLKSTSGIDIFYYSWEHYWLMKNQWQVSPIIPPEIKLITRHMSEAILYQNKSTLTKRTTQPPRDSREITNIVLLSYFKKLGFEMWGKDSNSLERVYNDLS